MLISWIVVGASPCAEIALRKSLARRPDSVRIACNAGIWLFENDRLDYYWLNEKFAVDNHYDDMIEAQARGVKVVTVDRPIDALTERRLENADILIPVERDEATRYTFSHDQYNDCTMSGSHCVQFALHNGAAEVHLCGMEGYRSHHTAMCVDYFTGEEGLKLGTDYTSTWIQPFLQSCVDQCPDTHFVLYGHPAYEITGPNLEVIRC